MKPINWVYSESVFLNVRRRFVAYASWGLLAWMGSTMWAHAETGYFEPSSHAYQVSVATTPTELEPVWKSGDNPDNWAGLNPAGSVGTTRLWYRVEFEVPTGAQPMETWSLYLPYLYSGGRLWFNGHALPSEMEVNPDARWRWEQPRLLSIPVNLLKSGRNVLHLSSVLYGPRLGIQLRGVILGPTAELLPMFDQRRFLVRTLPQYAAVTCVFAGLFMGYIWWRRRSEVLYGLFGLAAILWAIRTLTFVIEDAPNAWWWLEWRAVYHGATGGFIVVLALFAMRFANLRMPRYERVILAYWLLGPILILASAGRWDAQVGLWWTAGMIPVGFSILVFGVLAVRHQRNRAAMALLLTLMLGVGAGLHDYLLAWDGMIILPEVLRPKLEHRIFLLHHAANLLLLVMVSILTQRFVQSLDSMANLNRDLEERILQRETELQAKHAQLAQLVREQAVSEERQRIMQDLHDGLGSQLFTSLSRLERGAVDQGSITQMLRDCIADLRLTFELIATERYDFTAALGSLRFRWEKLFKEAGITSQWDIDATTELQTLTAASALHLLRISQEALTNVLKHAKATRVDIGLRTRDKVLTMTIEDNGLGIPQTDATKETARGIANMKMRARRLGADLLMASRQGCTRITLTLPLVNRGQGVSPTVTELEY
jgi:signal transduction histidine kinase